MFNFYLNVGVDLFYDVDLNVRCFLTNHSCGDSLFDFSHRLAL